MVLDYLSILALLFTMVSLIITLYSTLNLKKTKENDRYVFRKVEPVEILKYKVISKWNEIETIVHDLDTSDDNKYRNNILIFLEKYKYINNEDYDKLKKILQIRNSLVHSNGPEYSSEELLSTLDSVDEIIKKLTKK